jgi:hypothetical protein
MSIVVHLVHALLPQDAKHQTNFHFSSALAQRPRFARSPVVQRRYLPPNNGRYAWKIQDMCAQRRTPLQLDPQISCQIGIHWRRNNPVASVE